MKWKPILNYEGIYEVSDNGAIKSLKREMGFGSRLEERAKIQSIKKGYATVALCKGGKVKYALVHRLVAQAFIPNPKEYPQINHKNGNKLDNRIENLEWCEPSWNQLHAKINGLQGGEKNNTAKLTERDVNAIRRLYPKVNSRELAEAFGMGQATICKIINREYWKYVKP